MSNQLVYKLTTTSSIELSEDRRSIELYYHDGFENHGIVAKYSIEDIWDMMKDILATIDVNEEEYGLQRRQKEAKEARTFILRYPKEV
jgi:hypothetical protein